MIYLNNKNYFKIIFYVDGKYILSTCDKFIMVIKTENEFNINGFNTCLGKTQIKPLILHSSHNDLIKYNVYNEMFTPAKFNNNTALF